MKFARFVAWGYPLHQGTHSYTHYSFVKAFKHLGYETMWLTDKDDVSNIDFSNSLFLTEGQVDKRIPKRNDCYYLLHNCDFDKYPKTQLKLQTYFQNDPLTMGNQYAGQKLDNGAFYNKEQNMLYQPWATDLLPHEIDFGWVDIKRSNTCHWVGTIGEGIYGNVNEIDGFKRACKESGIDFVSHWPTKTSVDDALSFIHKSYLAPAIQGTYQVKYGYVSCRTFKNISYGHLGATNCKATQDLFDGQLVYNPDTYQLFYDMKKSMDDREKIVSLVKIVRDKHTFLNRIERIFSVL